MNRTRAMVIVACALVALMFAVVLTGRDARKGASTPPAPPTTESEATAGSQSGPGDSTASGQPAPLLSGKTLVVSRESLASGRPLVVQLQLSEPEASGAQLEGRIVTEGRTHDLSATVAGEAADLAQVEIEADWLTPGRYVIEIHTSERSHFPLRRYAIEVR
jgi:predicted phage tail protein